MNDIIIHNYDTDNQPGAIEQTWTTAELTQEFQVLSFNAPYVQVIRRSDGHGGTLEFKHSPRVYFNWRPSR